VDVLPTAPEDLATRYLNRELSWLDFHDRVLALAEDPGRPILARVKYLAICSQGLDEFFQVRVSGLLEQREAGLTATTPDGMRPDEQLAEIRSRVVAATERVDGLFVDELRPALDKAGIRLVDTSDLTDDDRAWATETFVERIFPVLTPLAVDPAHPFPYISSLSLNLAVLVRDPVTNVRRFARLKMPPLLPRFFPLPDGERFLPIEQLVAAHLDRLFPGMEIVTHHAFRVTRDADLDVEEDEADDLLRAVESILSRRRRGATSVRLELEPDMSDEVRALLMRELDLQEDQIYVTSSPLDLGALWGFAGLDRPELKEPVWKPATPPRFASDDGAPDVFAVLRAGDVLVQHPYDSFSSTVETFVEEAANDPDVLAIKQTLYRTSADTRIVRALIRAAEAGKAVVALVELQARFDEQANITWARSLEQAGVHVGYGVVGLKTHAKVCLVVRREEGGVRRYAHVGTGNYNSDTARLYEDLGLLTADQQIGGDVADLFNLLTGYSRQRGYGRLLVAPIALRERIVEMVRQQAALGTQGRIVLKLNSLVDPPTIDALYEASAAGVPIDLAVRGICCLRPGVRGLSDTIRVRSIVGRFLEHSRIYRFGEPGVPDARYFISSADLMPRNLDRRVEAAVPVDDPALRLRLDEILQVTFADDVLSWELRSDGGWSKVPTVHGLDAQETLMGLATARAREAR
jgi:polyphosphate kinase